MNLIEKSVLKLYTTETYDKNIMHMFYNSEEEHFCHIDEWGPVIWNCLHIIAHKVKQNETDFIKNDLLFFILYILKIVPCDMCSNECKIYFNDLCVKVNNKDDLETILFDFHNHVNKKNDVPIFDKDILHKYEKMSFFYNINLFIYMVNICPITTFERYYIQEWFINNIDKFINDKI